MKFSPLCALLDTPEVRQRSKDHIAGKYLVRLSKEEYMEKVLEDFQRLDEMSRAVLETQVKAKVTQ